MTRSSQYNALMSALAQPVTFSLIKRGLASKGALTIIDQVVYSASNFLTAVLVARNCSAQQFGYYILGLRLIDYFREAQNVLIWSPYMLFSPRFEGRERAEYTGSTLVHQLIFSLIVTLVFIGSGFIAESSFASLMLALAFVGVFFPLQEYTRRICFANFQTLAVVIFDSSITVIQLTGLFWLARQNRMSVSAAYWMIGAANALAVIAWLIWSRKNTAFVYHRVLSDFKKNWSQGKWLLGGNLTLLATTQVYPWALTSFHGAAAMGMLAAGEGVVNFIRAFINSIQNFLGPRLAHAYARGGKRQLRQVVSQTALILGLSTGVCSLVLAVMGGNLAALIYGSQFGGLRWIVTLLALHIFAWGITTSQSYALSTIERSDLNFKINVLGLILSIVLGLGLTLKFGAIGAASSLFLSSLLTAIVRQIVFVRLFKEEKN